MPDAAPLAELDQERVRSTLRAVLPAPHGFIAGIDTAADRALVADDLAAVAAQSDGLSVWTGEGDTERWVIGTELAWDSAFFGRPMARLDAVVDPRADASAKPIAADPFDGPSTTAVAAFVDACRARQIEHVVAVVPAEDLSAARALQANAFALVETRAVYHCQLDALSTERWPVREAVPADVPSLARAARETINPFDRFHADPSFSPDEAGRLMERWVEASVCDGFADLVLVPDVAEPEAFATAQLHQPSWPAWGTAAAQHVLAAVSPLHRGWHVKLISELGHAVRGRGAEHLFFTTQVTNRAAIRTTEKLGYRFGGASYAFRWTA